MPPSMMSPDTITASPSAALGADEAGQPDRAGRARDVLDRRHAHEARALQRLLHRARGLIPAAAGCRRRDDAQLVDAGWANARGPQPRSTIAHTSAAHAQRVMNAPTALRLPLEED